MTQGNTHRNIDPDRIAAIVREVVARLTSATATNQTANAVSIGDRLITTETIGQIEGTPDEIVIAARAVVTPAACDEARQRGITIDRSLGNSPQPINRPTANGNPTQNNNQAAIQIVDRSDPDRAASIARQIARRGITKTGTVIVLSQQPARDVHHYCTAQSERAVMITGINEIDRFAAELDPTVWVLDMERINFVVAVNIIARIAKQKT